MEMAVTEPAGIQYRKTITYKHINLSIVSFMEGMIIP